MFSTFNQDYHSFVAECCTHFPQLLVWEGKKNWSWGWRKGLKLGMELEIVPNKYGYIWSGFFLTPSQLAPDTQTLLLLKFTILKEVRTSKVRVLTFGLSAVIRLGIRHPRRKKERTHERKKVGHTPGRQRSRTVRWILNNESGLHHPLSMVIKLGFRHQRKKERKERMGKERGRKRKQGRSLGS